MTTLTDPRVLRAAELTLKGYKPAVVATMVGVNKRTVYYWLANPKVKQLIEDRAEKNRDLRTKVKNLDFLRACFSRFLNRFSYKTEFAGYLRV